VELPRVNAAYSELRRTTPVLDVTALPSTSVSSYDVSRTAIDWVPGWDLVHDRATWAPLEMVDMDTTVPGPFHFAPDSIGLASGNHYGEAVVHALCERIEHDADHRWQNRIKGDPRHRLATRVNLDSITDRACNELLDRCQAAEMAVGIWEQTSDVGVPTFRCTIVDGRDEGTRPGIGAHGWGAHPNRTIYGGCSSVLSASGCGRLSTSISPRRGWVSPWCASSYRAWRPRGSIRTWFRGPGRARLVLLLRGGFSRDP
jgi:ribosomal protein S12 methylthiotransferase accessory factor YcaO